MRGDFFFFFFLVVFQRFLGERAEETLVSGVQGHLSQAAEVTGFVFLKTK